MKINTKAKSLILVFLLTVISLNLVACNFTTEEQNVNYENKEQMKCQHVWLDATCTQPKTCKLCNVTEGEALGHDYNSETIITATCVMKGTIKHTCSRCKDVYTEDYSLKTFTSEEVYALAEKTVGEIKTYDKKNNEDALGSCFVINKDGTVLTNFHVIDEAYKIEVTINKIKYNVSSVLAYSEAIDLAVLKLDTTKTFDAVTTCTNTHNGGSTVYAVGSSEGYTLSFSTGVIASPDRIFDNVHYIQHEAAISSGNSGGPLFNTYGEVIGVNTASDVSGQNLNFAINISEYSKLDFSKVYSMADFYEAEGPYYETSIGDYTIYEGEGSSSYNNSQAKAQLITVNGTTIEGSVYKNDIDYYKIYVGAGQELSYFLIPDYASDATGILMGLLDSSSSIVDAPSVSTVGGITGRYGIYKNNSSVGSYFYVMLFYDTGYIYRNTVGDYSLFLYVK